MYDSHLFNFLNFNLLIYNLQVVYSVISGLIIVYLIIIVNVAVLDREVVMAIVLEIVGGLMGVSGVVVAFLGGILIGSCWCGLFVVILVVMGVLGNIGFLPNCLYYSYCL